MIAFNAFNLQRHDVCRFHKNGSTDMIEPAGRLYSIVKMSLTDQAAIPMVRKCKNNVDNHDSRFCNFLTKITDYISI